MASGDILFACTDCGDALCATQDMAGKSTHCPACGKEVAVPCESTLADPATYGGGGGGRRLVLQLILVVLVCLTAAVTFRNVKKALSSPAGREGPSEMDARDRERVSSAGQGGTQQDPAVVSTLPPTTETPEDPWDRIVPGLPRAEVLQILGRPAGRLWQGEKELLLYDEGEISLVGGAVEYCRRAARPGSSQR
jgi:DNA-directed RNA polymerase subunit RPC12/RpoP